MGVFDDETEEECKERLRRVREDAKEFYLQKKSGGRVKPVISSVRDEAYERRWAGVTKEDLFMMMYSGRLSKPSGLDFHSSLYGKTFDKVVYDEISYIKDTDFSKIERTIRIPVRAEVETSWRPMTAEQMPKKTEVSFIEKKVLIKRHHPAEAHPRSPKR